jgi:hypothetical protein
MDQRKTNKKHAIYVVHITVLPTSIVNIILWHGNLRTIENRRLHEYVSSGRSCWKAKTDLIHIIPDMDMSVVLFVQLHLPSG